MQLYVRVMSQYRYDFGRPTGLDYSAVYPLIDRQQLSHEDWHSMLDDIRVMEAQALETMRSQRATT